MTYRDTRLARGERLPAALAFAASLRCLDCPACRASLRAEHVERARAGLRREPSSSSRLVLPQAA